MKRKVVAALIAAVFALNLGCASILAGNDPKLVRAEQVESTAFNLANTFVTVEWSSRIAGTPLETSFPGIHAAAEKVRQNGPKAVRDVHRLIDTYIEVKGKGSSGADLDAAMAILDQLVADIQTWNSTTAAHARTARRMNASIAVGDVVALLQVLWEIYNQVKTTAQQSAEATAAERATLAQSEETAFASPAWAP